MVSYSERTLMNLSLESDVKSDQLEKEEEDVPGQSVVPSTTDGQPSNDVVHCICGSDIDEGFMIQAGPFHLSYL